MGKNVVRQNPSAAAKRSVKVMGLQYRVELYSKQSLSITRIPRRPRKFPLMLQDSHRRPSMFKSTRITSFRLQLSEVTDWVMYLKSIVGSILTKTADVENIDANIT